jgi:hypothetical protein
MEEVKTDSKKTRKTRKTRKTKKEKKPTKIKKVIKPLSDFFDEYNIADGKDFYDWSSDASKVRKKEANAVKSYAYDGNEWDYEDDPDLRQSPGDAIMLVDLTTFGSASDGFYITDTTLYAKMPVEDRHKPVVIKEITRITIPKSNDETYIRINAKTYDYMSDSARPRMRKIVSAIKDYLAQFDTEDDA